MVAIILCYLSWFYKVRESKELVITTLKRITGKRKTGAEFDDEREREVLHALKYFDIFYRVASMGSRTKKRIQKSGGVRDILPTRGTASCGSCLNSSDSGPLLCLHFSPYGTW